MPGVVLLDCVLTEAERWLGRTLHARSLRHAKFSSMLLPQESAALELQLLDQELRFVITRAEPADAARLGQTIAVGAFSIATALPASDQRQLA